MNERAAQPTADTVSKQAAAGHPEHSVWVSANAGSGKTHILTERVLRLLLAGVPPQNILCLTYTKAAAAEMQRRVADRLGAWALRDDAHLANDLKNISAQTPSEEKLALARTLFASALETPGGLKINTIHAFCEAALHRFPIEAGVPVDFNVIEEAEQVEMVRAARDAVLAEGLSGDSHVADAVATLFTLMSDKQIEDAVNGALGAGRELKQALADPVGARANLLQLLGLQKPITSTQVLNDAENSTLFSRQLSDRVFELTPPKKDGSRFEDKLARLSWPQPGFANLCAAFLTQKGAVPKGGFPKKIIQEQDPELAEAMQAEAERLAEAMALLTKAQLVERSDALLDVMGAIHRRYRDEKQRTGRLDFADLIDRFETLLAVRDNAPWVRYKLDSAITHILVDESQDTNPGQWSVVKLLVDDFFDGDSAVERPRTLFAVGDEKQSIYSFQGADPALFGETGSELGLRAMSAGEPWADIRFRASFRTLESILEGVDLVCARPDIREALLSDDEPVLHESARVDKGGMITLWPPVETEEIGEKSADWPLVPENGVKSAPRLLAERIAAQIKCWLDEKRPLAARGRAVRADDILILVQSRGPAFKEIIRALKQAGLPTPGADRLPVTDHIVVRDLLVLGDVLLSPNDDLALATLLRSPLFGLSEDQLELLCIERGKESLWRTLAARVDEFDWAATALERLQGWRQKLDFDRPYEFFASVLFADGGMKQFHARLGEEIDDVVGEFLDLALAHEQTEQPSLQGFLAALRQRDISIKRDLSESAPGVRVMSVHGAKGLEAPIVILADATATVSKTGPTYVKGDPTPMLVHASAGADHTTETKECLRQPDLDAQTAEYWRKLYVAMTRAEDELYVTGFLTGKRSVPEQSWYQAIHGALSEKSSEVGIAAEKQKGLRYPEIIAPPKEPVRPKTVPLEEVPVDSPDPVPAPQAIDTVRPSSVTSHEFDPADLLGNRVERLSGGGAETAKRAGSMLHLLLQHLAPIEQSRRQAVAKQALAQLLPEHEQLHNSLADKALSILSGPDQERLFGSNSRAELPLFVHAMRGGKPVRIIGRIDRVVVNGNEVLLVDFKSDAGPATSPDKVRRPYLVQLGLYLRSCESLFPDKEVSAAIYWTSNEKLMPLPKKLLVDAVPDFTFPRTP
ncbi:MAG TPA: double-strand break repair helicase AddA [Devosia sp.]|nr:double-strand break repair helicase AddA [Devosia sp.]